MVWFGAEYFFDASRRIFWLYLLSSSALALVWLFIHPKQKRVIFSKALWLHESAKLDYIYFIVSFFLKTFIIIPLIIGAKDVAYYVMKFLVWAFGYNSALHLEHNLILILYTTSIFLVSDFSRYWLHRFLHTIPFLWKVHKVHHSAKVLNPLTFYRIHPIENILFGFRYSLVIGLVTGVFIYLFGAKIGLVEVVGVNIFVFVFSFVGANLRHSHIALAYPRWLESIFISPKQHQMHHSIKYTHRNFGGALAIWDKIFGTISYSVETKNMVFGLRDKKDMLRYSTLWLLMVAPFKRNK